MQLVRFCDNGDNTSRVFLFQMNINFLELNNLSASINTSMLQLKTSTTAENVYFYFQFIKYTTQTS
jgi:hypothetical protein